jgi:amino acid transporter
VLTSVLASTQTTILPASRTTLSMARAQAMPAALGRIHPRYLTPHTSTIVIGVLAAAWYVVVNALSENFLFDTLAALSLMIAFYYALSGFACVIFYRHQLLRSVRNLLFIGVAPLIGALLLSFLFVRSAIDLADPDASYSGGSVLGLGVPLVIGGAFLILGAVLMLLWRFGHPSGYFRRRGFEAVGAPAVD